MLPDVMEMIRALVAMPSASSFDPARDQGNRGVSELLASWLDDLGCEVKLEPLPGPAARANLIATLGTGEGGLVLSGHSDTVACEGKWSCEPYAVTERDGRLYGLGIADMKAFFALALQAMRRVGPSRLKSPVILVATADEECGMQGARALVSARAVQARHAVIGEPTGLRPVRMHKGMLMESVRLWGKSGHSSVPAHGASALDGMSRVMQELLALREQLQREHCNADFEVPYPTLNLGTIAGGDHPNRICGACELQFDLRPLPGMHLQPLREMIRARLEQTLLGTGLRMELRSLYPGTEPMMTPSDAPVVLAAQALTGAPAGSVAYGTEAPHFAALGIEPVLLGPGDIAQAHQPDEFLLRARLEPGIDVLAGMIARLCC
jgi:acetylornithine deacetylase